MDEVTCAACGAPIHPEANVCRECGNDPGDTLLKVGGILLLVGVVTFVPVPALGAIISLAGVVVAGGSYVVSPSKHDY